MSLINFLLSWLPSSQRRRPSKRRFNQRTRLLLEWLETREVLSGLGSAADDFVEPGLIITTTETDPATIAVVASSSSDTTSSESTASTGTGTCSCYVTSGSLLAQGPSSCSESGTTSENSSSQLSTSDPSAPLDSPPEQTTPTDSTPKEPIPSEPHLEDPSTDDSLPGGDRPELSDPSFSEPQGPAFSPPSEGDGFDPESWPAVEFVAGDFTLNLIDSTSAPNATGIITINPDKVGYLLPQLNIQVDLNHDNVYSGDGETFYASTWTDYTTGQSTFDLHGLIYGTYKVRVEASTAWGLSLFSNEETIVFTQPAAGDKPLSFEQNIGQTDAAVKFLVRAETYTVFLTATEMVIVSQSRPATSDNPEEEAPPAKPIWTTQRIRFVDANSNVTITGQQQLPGIVNYFRGGDDRTQWWTDIVTFQEVLYRNLWNNIDLRLYSVNGAVQYDFIVHAGGDVNAIQLEVIDAAEALIDSSGRLVIRSYDDQGQVAVDSFYHSAPRAYQRNSDGSLTAVRTEFVGALPNTYGLTVSAYDSTRDLIIDPYLFGSFIGGTAADVAGSDVSGRSIALDSFGNIYVTGSSTSTNYPVVNPVVGPGNGSANQGMLDVVVSKFSPDGGTLLFSTYLGGSNDDVGHGIAVDSDGTIYVTGFTESTTGVIFPTTAGAPTPFPGPAGGREVFVTKLAGLGNQMVWSRFFGGTALDEGIAVGTDGLGGCIVTGFTDSGASLTANVFGPGGVRDGFLAFFDSNGQTTFATRYGGTGADEPTDMLVSDIGEAYICGFTDSGDYPELNNGALPAALTGDKAGRDAFVTIFANTGAARFSTYISASGTEVARGIALDGSGNIYVAGETNANNFFTTAGVVYQGPRAAGRTDNDAFLVKLTADRISGAVTGVGYSTYWGGNNTLNTSEVARGVAVDFQGNAYLLGEYNTRNALNFNVNVNPLQALPADQNNGFLTVFNANASGLILSTPLGSDSTDRFSDILVDELNNVYIHGTTPNPSNFAARISAGGGQTFTFGPGGGDDIFVCKIGPIVGAAVTDDRFEFNDSSDRATALGTISKGQRRSFGGLNTAKHPGGRFDDDWYSIVPTSSGSLTVNITNVRPFALGPSSTPSSGGLLHTRIYRLNSAGFLEEIGNGLSLSGGGQSVTVNVNAGDQIFIWVYGFYYTQAFYGLHLRLV